MLLCQTHKWLHTCGNSCAGPDKICNLFAAFLGHQYRHAASRAAPNSMRTSRHTVLVAWCWPYLCVSACASVFPSALIPTFAPPWPTMHLLALPLRCPGGPRVEAGDVPERRPHTPINTVLVQRGGAGLALESRQFHLAASTIRHPAGPHMHAGRVPVSHPGSGRAGVPCLERSACLHQVPVQVGQARG